MESYSSLKDSYTNKIRPRLRATDPLKYAKVSILLKDLIVLKTHFKGKVPSMDEDENFKLILQGNSKENKEDANEKRSTKRKIVDDNEDSPQKKLIKEEEQMPMTQPNFHSVPQRFSMQSTCMPPMQQYPEQMMMQNYPNFPNFQVPMHQMHPMQQFIPTCIFPSHVFDTIYPLTDLAMWRESSKFPSVGTSWLQSYRVLHMPLDYR